MHTRLLNCVSTFFGLNASLSDRYSTWYSTSNKGRLSSYSRITYPVELFAKFGGTTAYLAACSCICDTNCDERTTVFFQNYNYSEPGRWCSVQVLAPKKGVLKRHFCQQINLKLQNCIT